MHILVQRGYDVVCFARAGTRISDHIADRTRFGQVSDVQSILNDGICDQQFDAIISCMASRTGTKEDAWAIDYQAHLNILNAAKSAGIKQFILLSAICVQKPRLAFQYAKLEFEKALMESGLCYSIVRPTAFFKSLFPMGEGALQIKRAEHAIFCRTYWQVDKWNRHLAGLPRRARIRASLRASGAQLNRQPSSTEMGGSLAARARAAVDFPVPRSPKIITPPIRASTAAISNASFISS